MNLRTLGHFISFYNTNGSYYVYRDFNEVEKLRGVPLGTSHGTKFRRLNKTSISFTDIEINLMCDVLNHIMDHNDWLGGVLENGRKVDSVYSKFLNNVSMKMKL